ncbi:MAG TPA: hypothetical protein VGN57_23395 [Pirellulaceae bacterium]|nr:hypothetical protein [Pirellulaceae bacterium]
MQYSLKYVTLLLVAFSLALASSSWFPPLGSGATLLVLIVGLRLILNPAWLRPAACGTVVGVVLFASVCWGAARATGEAPTAYRVGRSRPWADAARRYAIPFGGIAGGIVGHALFVRSERARREVSADPPPDDSGRSPF